MGAAPTGAGVAGAAGPFLDRVCLFCSPPARAYDPSTTGAKWRGPRAQGPRAGGSSTASTSCCSSERLTPHSPAVATCLAAATMTPSSVTPLEELICAVGTRTGVTHRCRRRLQLGPDHGHDLDPAVAETEHLRRRLPDRLGRRSDHRGVGGRLRRSGPPDRHRADPADGFRDRRRSSSVPPWWSSVSSRASGPPPSRSPRPGRQVVERGQVVRTRDRPSDWPSS